jgi:dipeptidyl-peptidase-4
LTHFVDYWSDINTPQQVRLFDANGKLARVIAENRVAVLGQYKLGKAEFMRVKTRDGFEMEAMMIRPPDFDAAKKYPVMSFTYSGPQAPQVRNAWGGASYLWHQMLAQKGYIIWICDNRTASNKGVESAWPVYRNFGELELRDLEDGISWLKTQPYVDGSRIGLWGWSYGGFMTSYAMTHSQVSRPGSPAAASRTGVITTASTPSVTCRRRRKTRKATAKVRPSTTRRICTEKSCSSTA